MDGMIIPQKIQDLPEKSEPVSKTALHKDPTGSDLPDFMTLLFLVLDPQAVMTPADRGKPLQDDATQNSEDTAAGLKARPQEKTPQGKEIPSENAALEGTGSAPVDDGDGTWLCREEDPGMADTNARPPIVKTEGTVSSRVPVRPDIALEHVSLLPAPSSDSTSLMNANPPAANTVPQGSVSVEPTLLATGNGTAVDPNHVLEQISGKIISHLRRGGVGGRPEEHVIRISLHPESLGRIDVKVSMVDNQQISTSIVTESSMVKELIDSQQQSLRMALQEQGFKVGNLMVAVGQHMDQGNRQDASLSNGFKGPGRRGDTTGKEPGLSPGLGIWDRGGIDAYGTRGLINLYA